METPLLDVALIVKDEAVNLPDCLESIRTLGSLVGNICVYDTGSTDETVAIAEAAGATVELGYWDQDFARARNAAIAMCTAKWVLILDADERVFANPKILGPYLRQALRHNLTGADVIDVTVINTGEGRDREAWMSQRLLRPSRAQYSGRVHEQVTTRRPGKPFVMLDPGRSVIEVRHYGYSSMERVRAKTTRNAALAQQEIERLEESGENPELLIRALVDRARSKVAMGDPGPAVADLERVREMTSSFNYRWWGMEQLADLYIDHGRLDDAADLVDQLRREGSGQPYCDWLTARRLMAMGEIRGGMEILRRLDVLHGASGMVIKPRLLHESRMKGAVALGEFDEALACLIPILAAGEGDGYGGVLLRLWGDRPADLLAELIISADRGHLSQIADDLAGRADPGPSVARRLREAAGAGRVAAPV